MDTINEANKILVKAESKLRELMEAAIKDQRYNELAQIAALAEGIARISRGRPLPEGPLDSPARASSITAKRASKPQKRASGKTAGKDKYPQFRRDGDRLVKIGWSKKKKAAYEHRAPKEAVFAFTRHLQSRVRDGEVFSMEEVLPVLDPSTGEEVPAYQVYVTLAWLRALGAIQKKGRDGYFIENDGVRSESIEKSWGKLDS